MAAADLATRVPAAVYAACGCFAAACEDIGGQALCDSRKSGTLASLRPQWPLPTSPLACRRLFTLRAAALLPLVRTSAVKRYVIGATAAHVQASGLNGRCRPRRSRAGGCLRCVRLLCCRL